MWNSPHALVIAHHRLGSGSAWCDAPAPSGSRSAACENQRAPSARLRASGSHRTGSCGIPAPFRRDVVPATFNAAANWGWRTGDQAAPVHSLSMSVERGRPCQPVASNLPHSSARVASPVSYIPHAAPRWPEQGYDDLCHRRHSQLFRPQTQGASTQIENHYFATRSTMQKASAESGSAGRCTV
jgi:hypothetical protein